MRDEIERASGHAESPPDVELIIGDPDRRDSDPVDLPRAREDVLRQRGPLIGTMRLGTDQRDRPGEALFPQRLGGAEAGQ
jgi:hypothetical protein